MLGVDSKVLVVDDFHTMRNIVRGLLKQIGIKDIDEAEDGIQALEKLKRGKYNLVLSDLNMPNMNGIELLENIKKAPELKEIPFLMITADAEKGKIISAIKTGADGYIVKPFTAEALKSAIAKTKNTPQKTRPKI